MNDADEFLYGKGTDQVNGLHTDSKTGLLFMGNMWTHERLKAKKWGGWTRHPFKYVTYKLDGRRVTLFQQYGEVPGMPDPRRSTGLHAFSRDSRPHLDMRERLMEFEWYRKVESVLAPLSSLDGELWVKGGKRSDVVTAINDKAKELTFSPFAVPYFQGIFAPHLPRHDLGFVDEVASLCGLEAVDWFEWDNKHGTIPEEADMLAMLDEINKTQPADQKLEGFVLKNKQYEDWYKLKHEDTVDAIITGVIWSNAETNIGSIGSIVVSLFKDDGSDKYREIASCSGMTQEEREYMTVLMRAGELVGKVVEIRYQMVGNGGRLIHPRFISWRDDKPASECTTAQLNEE